MSGMTQRISALVNRVGQTITYKRVTGQSFNVTTGVNAVTYTDYSVKASLRDYSPREITGNVAVGDRKASIAGADLPFVPVKDDKIVADGITYLVVAPEKRNVGEEAGLYVLQIRGV